MCFSIPHQITKLKEKKAITKDHRVLDSSLVSVKTGDWILEQNGIIIKKISKKQARNVLKLIFNNF